MKSNTSSRQHGFEELCYKYTPIIEGVHHFFPEIFYLILLVGGGGIIALRITFQVKRADQNSRQYS